MQKKLSFLLFLLVLQISFAQNNLSWQGYFSYTQIKDVSESPNAIYAASENALFSKNENTNIIKTTTTVDGLSGETISALYYSPTFKKTIVGYRNGLITVINEADGSILKIVDIVKNNLPTNVKGINSFMEYGGIIYVAADFGIVQFNLATTKFGDTYFIGDIGTQIKVTQTTVFNGFIYASTSSGLRRADLSNPNLVDYNQWEEMAGGSWSGIAAFGSQLYAVNSVGSVHKYDTVLGTFNNFLVLPEPSSDLRATANYLVLTTANTVYVYDNLMVLQREINRNQVPDVNSFFTCATILNESIYIGTTENGLITTSLLGNSNYENLTPTGPLRNNIFSMQSSPTQLWAVYGDYDIFYNPYPKDSYGISKYSENGWLNIPYQQVLGAKSLIRVAIDPNNDKKVYIGSFDAGMLKVENNIPTILYNPTNSSIEAIANTNDVWVNGLAFDKTGNLWISNSQVENAIQVLKTDETWQTFSLKSISVNYKQAVYGRISIDKNGTKWLATNKDGIIGFNEKGILFKKITMGSNAGNLPTTDVRVGAVDNNNQLWIGTTRGLRVLSSVNNFLTENELRSEPIIIVEDNLAQELMYEQFITDIVVDGANNKWIGTADSGVFLVSPNGQQTKYHFNSKNSPLPSDVINDIDINTKTGEVFIATSKGLVSFKGLATKATEDLNSVFVYPNPVRPQYEGTVKISGLLNKANVKITDIAGNLVYEATSEGGTIEWDTTAFGRQKVASGVYMIFISARDASETKVKKVMIIR